MPEILAQVVALTDMVTAQAARILVLETAQPGGERNLKGGIFDNRSMEPEKFRRLIDFKDFVEDFKEYIEVQDKAFADVLDLARDFKIPIMHAGAVAETQRKAKALYQALKRNVIHSEAKSIVQNVSDKNPFEV